MHVGIYHPGGPPWYWVSADTPAREHHAELACRLARWGHRVESFVELDPGAPPAGPEGVRWRPLAEANPALPDGWFAYAAADPFPELVGHGQGRLLLDPAAVRVPDPDTFGRQVAVWNADLHALAGGTIVRQLYGRQYRVPNHFTYTHPWEEDSRREHLRAAAPGWVFLDVGASIGSWALPAAALGATVYAFEPGTDRDALAALAAQNGLAGRIALLPTLVAERPGRRVPAADIPWHSVPAARPAAAATTDSVDAFVARNRLGRVDLVKVDTDGGELAVLAGMAETLARLRPRVVVETHTFLGVAVAEVTAALGAHGYACRATPMEEGYYYHVTGEPGGPP